MVNTNGFKRATVLLIAVTVAVIYTLTAVACILIVGSQDNLTVNNSSVTHSTDSSSNTSSVNGFESNSSNISTNTSTESFNSNFSSETLSSSEIISSITSENSSSQNSGSTTSSQTKPNPQPQKDGFSAAIWLSYQDLDFKNDSPQSFKSKIDTMFDKAVENGFDTVICQVRPFADALYYSDYFPISSVLSGTQGKDPGYDALDYMVKAAHSRNLEIHAWLNPYRVTLGSTNVMTLAENHPARIWLSDNDAKNDRYVLSWDGRLYFNPAVLEVQKLILNGVREIVEKYDVDGIHIDDYFYPSDTPVGDGFDKNEYDEYKLRGGQLALDDWRRSNVSSLVSGMYRTVKSANNNVLFGVSPSYHISQDGSDDNYRIKYADLKKWMQTDGYIDYIVPQLYFGYNYPRDNIKFNNLLNLWMSINRSKNVKIYIGLGAYKIGDASADLSSGEWSTVDDIIARQTKDSKKAKCNGVFVFAYSSFMSDDALNTAQRNNFKQALISAKQE